ncbi:MAG TPA: hypothetical protein VIQ00_04310 [Chitinophagaceae bacterium]
MKKLLVAAVLLISVASYATPPEISEKVLKAFKETFKQAKDVTWDEFDDFYAVKFTNQNIDTRIRYDKEGNVVQTIRYYFEQQLPPFIQCKLKNKYGDKTVFGVTEMRTESEMSYYIILQDAKYWITIKSDELGNMQVHEKMKKA